MLSPSRPFIHSPVRYLLGRCAEGRGSHSWEAAARQTVTIPSAQRPNEGVPGQWEYRGDPPSPAGEGLAGGGNNLPEMQVNQTDLGGVQAEEIEVQRAELCLPGSCSREGRGGVRREGGGGNEAKGVSSRVHSRL